jgi:cell division protease FtsH
VIDEEVARFLHDADERATSLLKGHREALEKVSGLLVERETIDGEDVLDSVGGARPPERRIVVEEPTPAPS